METVRTSSSAKIKWHKQTFTTHNFVEKTSPVKHIGTPMEYVKKIFS